MNRNNNGRVNKVINGVVEKLCDKDSYKDVYHKLNHDVPMPSREALEEIVELAHEVVFPGYFGNSEIQKETMHYYIGMNVDKLYRLLSEQIKRGICFESTESETNEFKNLTCEICDKNSSELALKFIDRLPNIRRLLSTDVKAAFEGDPAAKSYGEAIFCYPSIMALTNYRIAHELLHLGVPLIPRIISEMAHSKTGIDIHPGAEINEYFFIDHGTGVVIGETCIIGKNVRLYQGVTLGAKSFPMDEQGNPIKGIARHPIVEDNVIIYSGATILGRITIGKGSVIGGNVWITDDIEPGSKIMQKKEF
jgi:serine O-acetyltransferase